MAQLIKYHEQGKTMNNEYLKQNHFSGILFEKGISKNDVTFQRLSSKAIKATLDNGDVYIIYINTIVFKMESGRITLNSDGWQGNTTKKWINFGLEQYYSKHYINQKNFVWYLNNRANGEKIEFKDNMILD